MYNVKQPEIMFQLSGRLCYCALEKKNQRKVKKIRECQERP